MDVIVSASSDFSQMTVVAPGFAATRRNGFWRTDLPIFADDESLPRVTDPTVAANFLSEARRAL